MFNGRIFICADIHGDSGVIKNVINQIDNPTIDDIIIVAGDAGFEYGQYIMGQAKRAAKKFPGKWIVMRGNHDNCYMQDHLIIAEDNKTLIPEEGWSFYQDSEDTYLIQNKYRNILYVNDNGGIYRIGDYNFLFLPGAYSVDKWYRLRMGYPYNEKEQLDNETMADLCELVESWNKIGFPIDYVIGHTFPLKMERYYQDLFMPSISQSSVDKTTEKWLNFMADEFEKNPDFKHFYAGHFHSQRDLTDKYSMVYQNPIEIETEEVYLNVKSKI